MGCIIKIKNKNRWEVFNTEAEAKQWIRDNNITIDQTVFTINDKDGKPIKSIDGFVTSFDKHQSTIKIIREIDQQSWTETAAVLKNIKTKYQFDGYDAELFKEESDAWNLAELLTTIYVTNEDGSQHLLFPKFVTNNWLNTLIQNLLLKLIDSDKYSNASVEELAEWRIQYFQITDDTERHDAQYYYNQLTDDAKAKVNTNDNALKNIDIYIENTVTSAFKIMLYGEIEHKIFELIIKNNSWIQNFMNNNKHATEDFIINLQKLFDEKFLTQYNSENFDEVSNPENIVNEVKETFFNNLIDNYIYAAIEAKKNIENSFPSNADKYWLSEKRITVDLDKEYNGKSKVRGKIDVIYVVDGVPHIIDFKISKQNFNNWNAVKKQKTLYTLEMYRRMLNKIGLNTNETTIWIYNMQIDADTINDDNNLKIGTWKLGHSISSFINCTQQINLNSNIQKNLDDLFMHVKNNEHVELKLDNINSYIEQLFGITNVKGRSEITKESLEKTLKQKIHFYKNKYYLEYDIFDSESGQMKHIQQSGKSSSELEAMIPQIADNIITQNENKFSIQYKILVTDLISLFQGNIHPKDFKLAADNTQLQNFYGALFYKYKGTGAKIIFPELMEKYGIILIQTNTGIDLINVGIYDPFSDYDQTRKNTSLFTIDTESNTLKRTIGNVNITKSLLIANELVKDLNLNIDNVVAIQLGNAVGHRVRVTDMKYMIDAACSQLHIHNYLFNKFTDPFTNVINCWIQFNKQIEQSGNHFNSEYFSKLQKLEKVSDNKKKLLNEWLSNPNVNLLKILQDLKSEFISDNDFDPNVCVEILKILRDILTLNYSSYFENPQSVSINPETALMAEIEKGIQIYSGTEVSDTLGLKRYSLGSSIMLNSMDTIPDENVAIVRNAINTSFDKIGHNFNDINAKHRVLVQQLRESKGYSKFRQYTSGDLVYIYDNLFIDTNNLEYPDLILKNPWTDPSLNEAERKYIKFMLFHLNKRKYHLTSETELTKTTLQDSIMDYAVPLYRADSIQQFRNREHKFDLLKYRTWLESTQEKIKAGLVSGLDIFEEQRKDRASQASKLDKFYNPFKIRRNKNIRKAMIERLGKESFSIDLETVLDNFIIADESEQEFNNNTIPLIRSILYMSVFNSHITGKDQNVLVEFITKSAKNIIYNESVMDEEVQEHMRMFAPLRATAFVLGLGFNIMNVPKEVLSGFFNNIRTAALATYGKETFSITDYLQAFGIMIGDIPGFIANITKIELLNEYYRMANMSITEIPEQVTTNKTGVFAAFNRFISWPLTAPDYWNRMSMFIAQMIHDGCWEAHYVEEIDGAKYLRYDITKDKRFDILCKYKGDIKLVPNSVKEKFNYQMSLYNIMLKEINANETKPYIYKPGETPYLSRAYTPRQRNSLKSFADTSFGYYDKETKALFFKTAVGQIFKQYLAYLAGKKVQYYQTGSNHTIRGDFEQLTDIYGNKIWRILDTEGNPINKLDTELTVEERLSAQPVLAWKGAYIEGIFQTYIHLLKDLGIYSYKNLTNQETLPFRTLWRKYTNRGNIQSSNLLQPWIDLLIANFLLSILRLIFFDDPEVTGISYKKQDQNANLMTSFLFTTVRNATQDFNAYQLIRQGLLVWESPTIGILTQATKNFYTNLGDPDLSLAQATLISTGESVSLFRLVRPEIRKYKAKIKSQE